ncbi:MAG: recombinase family protein [Desulfosporosinus sp.]|nr:recombinase family protein [Desulfosporosinus sp.]
MRSHWNPAWNFVGIYADQALSGKNVAKRPEFMRMVNDAENKKFDFIITKSISWFARNTSDCLETVRKLKSIGVGIYFEKGNINTLNTESELMLSILSSVAEEELNSISQNMHWADQRRFKQGKVMINTKRFLGYDKDRNGNLIINEEQATIVRRIFKDYLSGLGISLIAKGLDGFKTISGKVKWAESTVRDIIKNEKYIGDALLQKTITKDFKKKQNKGQVPMYYVKDTHPAIVSREDFENAQKLIKFGYIRNPPPCLCLVEGGLLIVSSNYIPYACCTDAIEGRKFICCPVLPVDDKLPSAPIAEALNIVKL